MSNNSGSEIGSFFAGFLVGGLVGAAAALLLAPQSGEETREQIRQSGIKLQGQAEETLAEARAKVEAVFQELIEYKSSSWVLANPLKQLEAMRDYFLDPERVPTATCHAGKTDIAVDPYGGLRLCFSLPPVGNLLDADPGRLLRSREARKRRLQIASCKRSCNLLNCNYGEADQA